MSEIHETALLQPLIILSRLILRAGFLDLGRSTMDTAIAIMIGIGLAAACGLRVFVPLLVLAIAARFNVVALGTSFSWLSTDAALIAFSVATVLEIVAYKVPWLDHLLDTVASPAAVVAGSLIAASQIGMVQGISPMWQWAAAIIAGGGAAAAMQATSVTTRAASTVATGGIANPLISTFQSLLSIVMSIVAVLLPILAIVLLLAFAGLAALLIRRLRRRPALAS